MTYIERQVDIFKRLKQPQKKKDENKGELQWNPSSGLAHWLNKDTVWTVAGWPTINVINGGTYISTNTTST